MGLEILFERLQAFTKEAYAVMKIPYEGTGKNNYGKYKRDEPSGHVQHYTASPDSSTARLRTLMRRFQVNSRARVGIAFIVFDCLHPELAKVRRKYPDLYGKNGVLKVDVLHYGLDLCFWSSNWANRFTCGSELRNAGKLYTKNEKTFYWGGLKKIGNKKYLYKGRPPVKVRGMWCEPFSKDQILASFYINTQLRDWMEEYTSFDPLHFMSHHLIHKNKWDCWPHFPFGRMKRSIINDTCFCLDGYIEELNSLYCPAIKDKESAEDFLEIFGYLWKGWDKGLGMLDENELFRGAIKLFQKKKSLPANGKLTKNTIKAMNGTRRVYRLTGKNYG